VQPTVVHVEFLVEELSVEAALAHLLPRVLLGPETQYQIHSHRGKHDLLSKLPARLRAYSRWIPEEFRICVLVDEDRDDCLELKRRTDAIASQAGVSVLTRIAVEELEAWFLGDPQAIGVAYPRFDPGVTRKARLRDPNGITGGTWEALERELQRVGYFKTGFRKVEAADAIARHMDPERNTSHSFKVFCAGLQALETGQRRPRE
jgi:hypothetical protein